jgi:hypothetical protein
MDTRVLIGLDDLRCANGTAGIQTGSSWIVQSILKTESVAW